MKKILLPSLFAAALLSGCANLEPSSQELSTSAAAPIKKPSEQPSAAPPTTALPPAAPAPTQGPPAAPAPPVATEKPAYLIPSAPFRTPDEARAAALSNPQVAAYHAEAEKWQNEINDTQRALQDPQSAASLNTLNARLGKAQENLNFYRGKELDLQNQYASPVIKALQDNNEANQKYFDEQANSANSRQIAHNQVDAIKNVLERFQPGTWSDHKAEIQGALKLSELTITPATSAFNGNHLYASLYLS